MINSFGSASVLIAMIDYRFVHAWDIWGSKLFLVTTEEYVNEAKTLPGGTFHEIEEFS